MEVKREDYVVRRHVHPEGGHYSKVVLINHLVQSHGMAYSAGGTAEEYRNSHRLAHQEQA